VVLRGGRWDERRVVSEEWLAATTARVSGPIPRLAALAHYGQAVVAVPARGRAAGQ
jgi:hypothetical protein